MEFTPVKPKRKPRKPKDAFKGDILVPALEKREKRDAFVDPSKLRKDRVKEKIEDYMLKNQCRRDTCVVALGGGVVADLASFVASTYLCGVPLVLLPTTIAAMLGCTVGGQASLNLPAGRDLVGAAAAPAWQYMYPGCTYTRLCVPLTRTHACGRRADARGARTHVARTWRAISRHSRVPRRAYTGTLGCSASVTRRFGCPHRQRRRARRPGERCSRRPERVALVAGLIARTVSTGARRGLRWGVGA